MGHITQSALKTILFRKNLRMSEASNKDFSSGEINSIIMGETGVVWSFIWDMASYIECPIDICLGIYYSFRANGWSTIFIVIFQLGFMIYHKNKGERDREKHEKLRQLNDQRSTYTVECLTNIKTLKLYGWEQKFKNKIEGLYQEALEIEDDLEYNWRHRIFDLFEGVCNESMNLVVQGIFIYMGGHFSLSTMVMSGIGLGKIRGNMHHVRHLYNMVRDFQKSTERLMNFYLAPEAQKELVNKVGADELGENSITVKGNFSYGVTPIKDFDEKKREIEKLEKKFEESEKKRIEALPFARRMMEKMKSKPDIKHEIKYAPRTMNQISQLKKIDLSVKKGEFIIIIGKIQSGKSSLMKTLVGELMNIPQQEIDFVGDMERKISYEECRALEDSLLMTSFENKPSPVNIAGSVSYVEQQHWI